jgi:hypothetical protein
MRLSLGCLIFSVNHARDTDYNQLEAKPLDIPVKLIIPTSFLSLKHLAPNLENSNISRITPRDESFKPIHSAHTILQKAFMESQLARY